MRTYIVYELFGDTVIRSEEDLRCYYNAQPSSVKSKYPSFNLWLKELFLCGLISLKKG